MEKKTRRKIFGIVVLIALVIIVLPFFQYNKELSTEAALIAPPPFPDQPAAVTSVTEPMPASTPFHSAEVTQPMDHWVVQIGSFKNKTNALNIVNQLRVKGYRAFIQENPATFNETTRVYVGPENKPLAANALAGKLQAEMHLKGIVMRYKPFTL